MANCGLALIGGQDLLVGLGGLLVRSVRDWAEIDVVVRFVAGAQATVRLGYPVQRIEIVALVLADDPIEKQLKAARHGL